MFHLLVPFFRPDRIARGFPKDAHTFEEARIQFQASDLVTDHANILWAAPANAFKVSIFRSPLQRLLSERREWMQQGPVELLEANPMQFEAITTLQKQSMVDILEAVFEQHPILVPGFWNHQATTLAAGPLLRLGHLVAEGGSGPEIKRWLTDNKRQIANRALAALKSLDYVGLMEDFDVSVHEVFARIGLPEPGGVHVRNAREAMDDERDSRIQEMAQEFLELDNELYEAAVERHAVFGRAARGTPVDYIGRVLTAEAPLVISADEAPGGHGWHPAHQRADGAAARWSSGSESRIALSAGPGLYSMRIEAYGAASDQTLPGMQIEIDRRTLATEAAQLPDGLWIATATVERARHGRFDILFRLPDVDGETGFELKQISFQPIRRWIVHIGAPKTGSTAIQRFLHDNRALLPQHGVHYPEVSLRGYGHHDLAFLLNGQYPEWAKPQDRSLADLGADLRAALKTTPASTIVLSSENFYLYPQPAKLRDFLLGAGMTAGDEVRIVCYVRRQDEALVSWYNQTVKAQGNTGDFEATVARDSGLWDYARRLEPWYAEFGAQSIVLRDYSPFGSSEGDVRADFLDIIGLPLEAFDLPSARANERINRDVLEFQRLVNRLPLKTPLKRHFHKRLIELTTANAGRGIFDDSPFVSGERRGQLVQSYAAGNRWVAQTLLGRNELFEPVPVDAEEEKDSTRRGLTPAKIALILGSMLFNRPSGKTPK